MQHSFPTDLDIKFWGKKQLGQNDTNMINLQIFAKLENAVTIQFSCHSNTLCNLKFHLYWACNCYIKLNLFGV